MTRRISGVIALFITALLLGGCTAPKSAGGGGGGGGGSRNLSAGSGHHHRHHHHKVAPSYTVAQQQAISAARNYLSGGMGYSKRGLMAQLTSHYGSGFKKKDVLFAINHINVDYRTQAVMAAKNYMQSGMGYSRSGLIAQLTSSYGSQFTHAQAVYGANRVGLH